MYNKTHTLVDHFFLCQSGPHSLARVKRFGETQSKAGEMTLADNTM